MPTDLDLHGLSLSMSLCINKLDQVMSLAENCDWVLGGCGGVGGGEGRGRGNYLYIA